MNLIQWTPNLNWTQNINMIHWTQFRLKTKYELKLIHSTQTMNLIHWTHNINNTIWTKTTEKCSVNSLFHRWFMRRSYFIVQTTMGLTPYTLAYLSDLIYWQLCHPPRTTLVPGWINIYRYKYCSIIHCFFKTPLHTCNIRHTLIHTIQHMLHVE